jgi:hypothetical protein
MPGTAAASHNNAPSQFSKGCILRRSLVFKASTKQFVVIRLAGRNGAARE